MLAILIALTALPVLAGLLLGKWKSGTIAATTMWFAALGGVISAVAGAATANQMAFALSYMLVGVTAGLLGARLFARSLIASIAMATVLDAVFFGGVFIFGVTVGCSWSGQCL